MDDLDAPKTQDNTHKGEANSETSGSGILDVPSISPAKPSPPCKHHYAHHHENTTPWWKKLDTYRFVTELAILIITLRIACIYNGQLTEMRKSTQLANQGVVIAQEQEERQESESRIREVEPHVIYSGIHILNGSKGIFADVIAVNDGSPNTDSTQIAVKVEFDKKPEPPWDFVKADSQGINSRTVRKAMENSSPPSKVSKIYVRGVIRYTGIDGTNYDDVPFCVSTLASNVVTKKRLPQGDTFPSGKDPNEYGHLSPPSPIDSCAAE